MTGKVREGEHVGSGGRVVKMIVAISFGKRVIYCEQCEKLDSNYYANFIRRNFQNMFQRSEKCSKLFVEDNCPKLNCARARKALKEVEVELFLIPKRVEILILSRMFLMWRKKSSEHKR